ncbi:MAG: alcohol dehydrogenase catalytic domain-containing protein, partial [Gemmatimonadales bacterium]
MKALTLSGRGGLEYMRVGEVALPPPPGAGEALVRIHSAALNRLDLFVANGRPGVELTFPHVLGSDGAGVVESVGQGVSGVKAGHRVMINPGLSCGRCAACAAGEESLCSKFRVLGEHRGGTAAEYIVLPSENLAPVPEKMPWAQAAAFSLATLTAWRMLATRARLLAGETVLIWGIGGGVAMAALQVAVFLGARTIVTSGSDAKLEVARREGAAETINHSSADVPAEVRRLTGGLGVDVVVDSVGEQSWQ